MDVTELVNLDEHRFIPAKSLRDKEGNPLDEKTLEALPRFLTFKEYQLFIGEKPYAKEELELMPEFNEHTRERIHLNRKINILSNEDYYCKMESETKGIGDVIRLDLAEDIVYHLKKIIGNRKEQILKDFEAYNQQKMREYWEKQKNND